MEALSLIGVCLLMGLTIRRTSVFPENTAQVLNLYVIWVALPALIIAQIPKLSISLEAIYPVVFAWSQLIVSVILVIIAARIFRWSSEVTCVLLLLVPLGNTSFVGIPMVSAFIGESAIRYALLYDQLGSFLALTLYGSLVLSFFSSETLHWRQLTKRIVTFPPFIALIAGLCLSMIEMPSLFYSVANRIGTTLVPTVMVAVGFQWQFRLPRSHIAPFFYGLSIKLLFAPMLALLLTSMFLTDSLIAQTIVLEAGMAPMISAGALLVSHNRAPGLVAGMVGYGLLFSLVTLPFWWWIQAAA